MLTCGIFYCRDSAEINDCGSLQTSSWLDSDMLRNRQQKHTANPLGVILGRPTKIMKPVTTILFLIIFIASCRQPDKKVSRFDNIPKSDTTCLKELEKAKKDFNKGKLIYCNYTQFPRLRCEKEMAQLLEKYNIPFENEYASDVIIEGQTDGCYCDYMQEQIETLHGKKFIDSLLYIADSIFISKNLDKNYSLS